MRAFLQLQRVGATLGCGEQASHCGGFSCGAPALVHTGVSSCGTWAQWLQHNPGGVTSGF